MNLKKLVFYGGVISGFAWLSRKFPGYIVTREITPEPSPPGYIPPPTPPSDTLVQTDYVAGEPFLEASGERTPFEIFTEDDPFVPGPQNVGYEPPYVAGEPFLEASGERTPQEIYTEKHPLTPGSQNVGYDPTTVVGEPFLEASAEQTPLETFGSKRTGFR